MRTMLIWITVGGTLIAFAFHWLITLRYEDYIYTANAREPGVKNESRAARGWQSKHPNLMLNDIMMIFVSLAILGSSLFIILSGRYDDASQKWAFGSVGAIFGFWCRRK